MRFVIRVLAVAGLLALALLSLPAETWASQPNLVTVTNVTDQGFTVSWYSRFLESGTVSIGTSSTSCSGAATTTGDEGNGYSHYFEISGLTASTAYYYQVASGGSIYPSATTCYGPVSTYATLLGSPPSPKPIIDGIVNTSCTNGAPGAILTLTFKHSNGTTSQPLSAFSGSSGAYVFNYAGTARTSDGSAYFAPVAGDTMSVQAEDGNIEDNKFTVTYNGGDTQTLPTRCLYSVQYFDGNPGFENSTIFPWQLPSTGTVETTTVHGGSKAVQVNAAAAGQTVAQQIAVAPNQTYMYSAWVQQTVTNDAYMVIRDADTLTALPGGYAYAPATTGTWIQLTGTITTGAATRWVQFVLNERTAGTVYWDDTDFAPTSLVNPGFEMSPHGSMGYSISPPSGSTAGTQSATVHSGQLSMRVNAASSGTYVYQLISVQPGSRHTFSGWLNQSVNAGYAVIWDFTHNDTTIQYAFPTSTVNAWQQVTATFTVPSGCTEILVVMRGTAAGTYLWDDLNLT